MISTTEVWYTPQEKPEHKIYIGDIVIIRRSGFEECGYIVSITDNSVWFSGLVFHRRIPVELWRPLWNDRRKKE